MALIPIAEIATDVGLTPQRGNQVFASHRVPTKRGPHGKNLFDPSDPAVTNLPENLRQAILKRSIAAVDETAKPRDVKPASCGSDAFDGVSKKAARRADAKGEICVRFNAFRETTNLSLDASLKGFVALYNQSQSPIQVSDGARQLIQAIAVPTLRRDLKKYGRDGAAGLVPGYRGADSIIESNSAMRDFVVAAIAHDPLVRAR